MNCLWEDVPGTADERGWRRVRCTRTGCMRVMGLTPDPHTKIHATCRDPSVAGKLGPGTHLKRIFAYYNIQGTADCGCEAKASEMDARGADWCEENVETICDWLAESAKKRGVPFIRFGARWLVRLAIARSRQTAEPAIDEHTPVPIVTAKLLAGEAVAGDSPNIIEARNVAAADKAT